MRGKFLLCDFSLVEAEGLMATKTDFTGSLMTAASLEQAVLANSSFSFCDLTVVSANRAMLKGSIFYKAKLFQAQFNEANLEEALICGVNGKEAVFTNAKLNKASFLQSDLQGSNLTGAETQGTLMTGANLEGATQ